MISIPYLTSFRTLYNGTIGWLNGQLFSLLTFDQPTDRRVSMSINESARFANVIDIHNHRWCFRWCQCNFSHQSAPLWPAKMLRLNSFRLDKLKSFSLLPSANGARVSYGPSQQHSQFSLGHVSFGRGPTHICYFFFLNEDLFGRMFFVFGVFRPKNVLYHIHFCLYTIKILKLKKTTRKKHSNVMSLPWPNGKRNELLSKQCLFSAKIFLLRLVFAGFALLLQPFEFCKNVHSVAVAEFSFFF